MDLVALAEGLLGRFTDGKQSGPGWQTRLADETVPTHDLTPVFEAACRNEADRDRLADLGPQGLIAEGDLPSEALLSFDWESWGAPTSSSDSVDLVEVGAWSFVHLPKDMDGVHPDILVGAVRPSGNAQAVSSCVSHALDGFHRDTSWIRLPTGTYNSAPDLVLKETIRSTYLSLATRDPTTWEALQSDLETLVEQASVGEQAGMRWDERYRLARELSDLFDVWFDLTYRG